MTAVSRAVILFFVTASLAGPATAQQAAVVGVDQVRSEPLSQTVPIIGRFVARQSGVVAARVAGAVTELPAQVGDRVKKGDLLAVVDLERLTWLRDLAKSTEAETEALVNAAQVRLASAQKSFSRLEGIRDSAAFNEARYDGAVADVYDADARLAAARAVHSRAKTNLALAEYDLRNARVRAPYEGVVSLRHTEVGSWVGIGGGIVTLINDTDLEIEADVPYNRVAGLAAGTQIVARLDDGSTLRASVRAVGAEENPMARTRQVRFAPAADQAAGARAVGQSIDVLLPLGAARTVVTVHKDAILKRQGMSLVYVVDAESNAQIRPVELGEAAGDRFVVLDGLQPGETVVVRGNERLRPGQAVTAGAEG